MTIEGKIKAWTTRHVEPSQLENVFIPKHGVTKQVAEKYWKKRGTFNGVLYDELMRIKLEKA